MSTQRTRYFAANCLVGGGGDIASRKIESQRNACASIVVVAKTASPALLALAAAGELALHLRAFFPDDLDDKLLVIAATDDDSVNDTVAGLAATRRIPVNSDLRRQTARSTRARSGGD